MSRFVFVSLMLAGFVAAATAQGLSPQATPQHDTSLMTSPSVSKAGPEPGDRNCIRDTGSLIRAKPGQCLPVAGRSYNQDDIQRTGRTSLGPALRDLDPSITVGR